jgi:hypothetical protein
MCTTDDCTFRRHMTLEVKPKWRMQASSFLDDRVQIWELLRFLPGHVLGQTTLLLGLVKLFHEALELVGMCQELIENASGQN